MGAYSKLAFNER